MLKPHQAENLMLSCSSSVCFYVCSTEFCTSHTVREIRYVGVKYHSSVAWFVTVKPLTRSRLPSRPWSLHEEASGSLRGRQAAMASSLDPSPFAPCGAKQLSPCVQLNSALLPGRGMLRHQFMASVAHKNRAILLRWIQTEKKMENSRFSSSQVFKPSCHCFPRWLSHKRGAGVNSYKLSSAHNAN